MYKVRYNTASTNLGYTSTFARTVQRLHEHETEVAGKNTFFSVRMWIWDSTVRLNPPQVTLQCKKKKNNRTENISNISYTVKKLKKLWDANWTKFSCEKNIQTSRKKIQKNNRKNSFELDVSPWRARKKNLLNRVAGNSAGQFQSYPSNWVQHYHCNDCAKHHFHNYLRSNWQFW